MEKKQKKETKKVVAVKSKSAIEIERLCMKKKMTRMKKERKRIEEEAKTEENTRKRNGTAKQHQRGVIREIPQSDAW